MIRLTRFSFGSDPTIVTQLIKEGFDQVCLGMNHHNIIIMDN